MMNKIFTTALLTIALALPAAASTWTTGTYVYDGSGNIVRVGADQYVYDRNGRLTKGTANGTSHRQEYTYDSFGNRLSAATCVDEDCTPAPLLVTAATNHVQGAEYGDAGNVEIDPAGRQYAFDAAEMISSQTGGDGAEYIYTADDQRIAVHEGTEWQWSVRDLAQHVARDFTSSDVATGWTAVEDYVHTDYGSAGSVSAQGRRHMHLDHLGTPRLITTEDGRQVGFHAYYPFGEELVLTTESPEERLKFTGHERDDSGLDYMHARYYTATEGRFLSIDPALDVDSALTNPQAWNRYAYVYNNPILHTDPTGEIVDLSQLTQAQRDELLQRLNLFTGNVYDVDENKHLVLVSTGQDSSATATTFLNKAMGSTTTYGVVSVSGKTQWNSATGNVEINFENFTGANYGQVDPSTFNLGSSLVHELIHGVDGKQDLVNGVFDATSLNWTGDTVDYENQMRAERNLPLRASYLTENVRGGKERVRFNHVDPAHPAKIFYVVRKKF